MSSLAELQRWMLEALIAPGQTPAGSADATFLPGPGLSAAGGLGVYQRSYILRLRQVLAEQLPATRHALGAPLFDAFADDYLRACPSDSHTLYELGRRFVGWMEDTRPDRDLPADQREDWIDFMVDLASYEQVLFRLFDAPGHEGRPWPEPGCDDDALILQPCLSLACYRYPVAWYYHEVRAGRQPAFPPARPSPLVILRRGYQTSTYPISALHLRFLELVRELDRVEPALEGIAAWTGRPLPEVRRSWLQEVRGPWLEAGFFVERGSERSGAGPQVV